MQLEAKRQTDFWELALSAMPASDVRAYSLLDVLLRSNRSTWPLSTIAPLVAKALRAGAASGAQVHRRVGAEA